MLTRKPYLGLSRKLVLAFDVGTTYSGVSYCILDPGEVPKIQGVARYPAQEHVGGDSKIPSILWYDQQGVVRAVGAEALQEHILEQAEDNNWVKLEWWKLHLRAKNLTDSHFKDNDIPVLPGNMSGVKVLGDFMKYLYECARNYIQDTHANGSNLLKSVENNIEFVLSHPNGWEGPQQSQIRRAAVAAGLIPSTQDGQSRIHLVTEGEASLHFCVANVFASESMSKPLVMAETTSSAPSAPETNEQGVIIVDAGGGTIDLSAYSMSLSPQSFEEIAPTECRLQGSVFVTLRAHTLLRNKLRGSRFGDPAIVGQMKEIFDKTTKLRFRNAEDPSYIKFGTLRDKDPQYEIRSGQLKMQGADVASLFEPAIESIKEAIEQQRQKASMPISWVFLVGGFAASDWLFSSLQKHLQPLGIHFCRPDSHVNKAVADGAVSYYIDHLVSSRVARYTYGTECGVAFDPTDPEHQTRRQTVAMGPSGMLYIPNAFVSILTKGTRVSESQEFRQQFFREVTSISQCGQVEGEIQCYRGPLSKPAWVDEQPAMFSTLCTIRADTSKVASFLKPTRLGGGRIHYRIKFDVVLLFGLTELKAQVSWMEEGVEQRSPAVIVYDEEVEEVHA